MVVAVTEEGELLLVEEYRFPLHARTIGLPAGLSGDGGEESTLESARRELEEETGYSASFWTYLFTGPSSPGLTTEMVSFYLADGLRQVAEGGYYRTPDSSFFGARLADGPDRTGKGGGPENFHGTLFSVPPV